MKVGPKTKAWLLKRKAGPMGAFMEVAETAAKTNVADFIKERATSWEGALTTLYEGIREILVGIPDRLLEEGRALVKKKIEELPHIKGDAGYTPIKGKDYFDGKTPVKDVDYFDGRTPVAGVDYFTREQTEKMIGQAMANLFDDIQKKGFSAGAAEKMMQSMFEALPIEKIARGLEKLSLKEKLDYHKGLKNTPVIPDGTHQRTLHRGVSLGGAGSVSAWQTPDEEPDSTITVFTVGATAPTDVVRDGAMCFLGPNGYTFAAGQITFAIPPTYEVRYR